MEKQRYFNKPGDNLLGIGGDEKEITLNYPTNEVIMSDRDAKRLIRFINRHGADSFYLIEAYTDDKGGHDLNKKLSTNRGEIIKSLMSEFGVLHENIKVVAHGEENPKYPNDTAENRAKNRRVIVSVVDSE
jgi:outer membrane protein OmpA-like peptidoglycan-associated protein